MKDPHLDRVPQETTQRLLPSPLALQAPPPHLQFVRGGDHSGGHQRPRRRPSTGSQGPQQPVPVSEEGPRRAQVVHPHEAAGGEGQVEEGHDPHL